MGWHLQKPMSCSKNGFQPFIIGGLCSRIFAALLGVKKQTDSFLIVPFYPFYSFHN